MLARLEIMLCILQYGENTMGSNPKLNMSNESGYLLM